MFWKQRPFCLGLNVFKTKKKLWLIGPCDRMVLIRHQAITRSDGDPDLWYPRVSLAYILLTSEVSVRDMISVG